MRPSRFPDLRREPTDSLARWARRVGRPGVRARVALVPLLGATLAGCAGLLGAPATGPDGLALRDRHLRDLLSQGRYDAAYESVAEGRARPDDRLLRFQYEGLLAHHAGRYGRSNASLQAAADLAEARFTRSLTKSALSLVTNDRILDYRPPAVERLLVHYYGILNYLGMGDAEGAGVEARRLAHLLDLYADRGELEGPGGRRLHAALRYATGAAFEAIGEENDAAVAYRLARGLDEEGRLPAAAVGTDETGGGLGAGPPLGGPPETWGEVLVIVERGFAPHRVERASTLLLWSDEVETLRGVGAAAGAGDERAEELALALARRTLAGESRSARRPGRALHEKGGESGTEGPLRLPRPLRIAWPAYRFERGASLGERGEVRLLTDGRGWEAEAVPAASEFSAGPAPSGAAGLSVASGRGPWAGAPSAIGGRGAAGSTVAWAGDVAGGLLEEGRDRQPTIVARAILRAAAKLAIAQGIEEELEEEDERLGEITGSLLATAGALTERADTRCWSLLPAEIGFVRLQMPAGRHRLALERAGGPAAGMEIGEVNVRPGRLVVVNARHRL